MCGRFILLTDLSVIVELMSILKPYPVDEMMMSPVDPGLFYRPKAQESAFLNA